MAKINNPEVAKKFSNYPDSIREMLLFLRQLVLDTASEMGSVGEVEETLKWGEPSYITNNWQYNKNLLESIIPRTVCDVL